MDSLPVELVRECFLFLSDALSYRNFCLVAKRYSAVGLMVREVMLLRFSLSTALYFAWKQDDADFARRAAELGANDYKAFAYACTLLDIPVMERYAKLHHCKGCMSRKALCPMVNSLDSALLTALTNTELRTADLLLTKFRRLNMEHCKMGIFKGGQTLQLVRRWAQKLELTDTFVVEATLARSTSLARQLESWRPKNSPSLFNGWVTNL